MKGSHVYVRFGGGNAVAIFTALDVRIDECSQTLVLRAAFEPQRVQAHKDVSGHGHRPPNPLGPSSEPLHLNFENTPRALITDFDTTKRTNLNLDYNHYFSGFGTHSLRAGWGLQHRPEAA